MVHSLTLFTSITSTVQISVKLPNGDVAKVTHIGTVQFSSTLILENVLCIPKFSFNLIFISKLTQSPTCYCIFPSRYCFIQDLQPWRMIRFGKKQGGLYTLQPTAHATLPKPVQDIISNLSSISLVGSVNTCIATHAMDDTSLWHCRLGHPSAQRLALLHSIVPGIISYINNKFFLLFSLSPCQAEKIEFSIFYSLFFFLF